MGEQVAVEGGVVIQEAAQIEGCAGGGEIGQADLSRCDDGPIALSGDPMVGVGGPLAYCLEDHGNILVNEAAVGAWGSRGSSNIDDVDDVDCIDKIDRIDLSRGAGPLGSTCPGPSEVGSRFRYLSH